MNCVIIVVGRYGTFTVLRLRFYDFKSTLRETRSSKQLTQTSAVCTANIKYGFTLL